MSKAYLAWPVKLTGCVEETHVTLKFIGRPTAATSVTAIATALRGLNTRLPLKDVTWSPVKFGPSTYVLKLSILPLCTGIARDAVNHMRAEDFPTWQPHITVPKGYWEAIKKDGIPLGFLLEDVGPLTLFVDKKAVAVFE